MTDLLSDRARILLLLDRELFGQRNEAVLQACNSALAALDRDPRGYAPQYVVESENEDV